MSDQRMGIPVRLGKRMADLTRIPFLYRAWQNVFRQQKIQLLLQDSQFKIAHRILDVGCGPGTNAGFFLDRDYLGVDSDPRYVESAKKKFGDRFVLANAVDYSFGRHGKFDLVLINSLLHHLKEKEVHAVLANIRHVMGPGSTLHVFDLVLPLAFGLPKFLAEIDRGGHPRLLSSWRRLFNQYFEEVIFRPYRLSWAGVSLYEMVYFKGTISISNG